MSLVDIIITNYNREKLVELAIKSVLKQTFNDWKLYVYDDGSTDDSVNVIKNLCSTDKRCHYIISSHIGINGECKNLGSKNGKSKYLCFVDSDDQLAPNALEEIMKIHSSNPYQIVYSDQSIIDSNGNHFTDPRNSVVYSADNMLNICCIRQLAVMERKLFEQLNGHDINYIFAADFDFFIRASEISDIKVYHLQQPLYYRLVHPGQVTKTFKVHHYAFKARKAGYLRRGLQVPQYVEDGANNINF